MKVAIVVITYNISSEIFILQIQAIRKFCKDEDYTIEIFDNSDNPELTEGIRYHSEQLEVTYCKIQSSSKNSSDSHCWAANFAYQKIKDSFDYVFFADHDLIPIKEFSVVKILSGGHVMAGLGQGALKKYMWQGTVLLSLIVIDRDIVDFSTNSEFRLDSGGNLYKIIEKYGEENCIFFDEVYHQNPYFSGNKYNSYAVIFDGVFMHMINSSNWNDTERHEERMNTLINIAKEKTGL